MISVAQNARHFFAKQLATVFPDTTAGFFMEMLIILFVAVSLGMFALIK